MKGMPCKIGKKLLDDSRTYIDVDPVLYYRYRIHLVECKKCQRNMDIDVEKLKEDLKKEKIIHGELWRLQEVRT
jgi:hypothetical protein